MQTKHQNLLLDIWSFDKNGAKVFPCKVLHGPNAGLFSVCFTGNLNKYIHVTEEELIKAIKTGKFKNRGCIRMLPLVAKPGAKRNGYAPQFYLGEKVKSFAEE